jgi:glycosyltransferase involved in cell wall biosynthesis
MPKKLKILVSAYACAPNKGSEPGMGWNFVMGLSNFHELHVIVEKRKWEQPILEYLKVYPELKANLRFYFIDKTRNKRLRKIWPPSYYWFYNVWQKKAYKLALELDKKENFDLIHQLNMVGYREPGYLWKIEKPFVWGPIGGLENSPWRFLPSLGIKGFIFYTGRNLMNLWQRNFSTRPKKAARRTNTSLIAATPDNQRLLYNLWDRRAEVVCEVGQEKDIIKILPSIRILDDEPLKIVWSGLHNPRKNLPLLFNALKKITIPFELHILGNGEMTKTWKKIAQKKGLDKNCNWYGWVERQKAIDIMSSGHVFCITSISDLTSTVTLEALSYSLPIISLDHCGFSHVVNDSCGIKINVSTPKKATLDFSLALKKIYEDENLRQRLSEGALLRAKDFSWESKINRLNDIYNELLKN